MSDWNPQANEIFLAALERPTVEERRALLDDRCGADRALRAQVESLLAAGEQAGSFLEHPPVDGPRTAPDGPRDAQVLPEWTERTQLDPGEVTLDFLSSSDAPGALGRVGPYEITEVIGRGGMGLVLKARDLKLNRVVAIKVLAPELAGNATARRRFLREAKTAAAMAHQHVVTIHAVDEDRLPYLVMEYVDGQSLQEKLDREGHLGPTEILRIGVQIAWGLAAAHQQGVIHRDIKPANILLENGIERVRITDFGLARAVDDVSITKSGEVSGTPQYMSPEQAQGQAVDARSDLFNLGCVLYAMCTGRSPFRAESTVAAIRRVCDEQPRPIREVNPEVPEWFVAVVERLLEKNPDDRLQSATEVADLLGRHLAHMQDPDSTPQPGTLRRLRRPRASWRGWLAAGLAVLLVAIGFGLLHATGLITFTGSRNQTRTEASDPESKDIAAASTAPQVGHSVGPRGEIDLLRLIDPDRGSANGRWRMAGGVLVSPSGAWDRINIPYEPPEEYDVELTAERKAGTDLLSIALVSGPRQFFVALDMFGGTISGLGLIDGKDAFANETTREQPIFRDGLPHKIVCRVRRDGVAATVDGEPLFDWRGELERLSVPEAGRTDQLELTTMNSVYHVYDLVLRPAKTASAPESTPGALVVPEVARYPTTHSEVVFSLAVSPDGRLIASGSSDGTIHVFDRGANVTLHTLESHFALGLRFTSDGRQLLSAGDDGTVRLWDVETGNEIRRFEGHEGWVLTVALSRDGQSVLSGGEDGTIRLWDFETATELDRIDVDVRGPKDAVFSVKYSDDGSRFVSSHHDGTVTIWNAATLDEITTFAAHSGKAYIARFDPQGRILATTGNDDVACLWDDSGRRLHTLRHADNVTIAEFIADGRYLVTGSGDQTLRVWSVETGEEIARATAPTHCTTSLGLLPDGRLVSAGGLVRADTTGDEWVWRGDGDYDLHVWRLPEAVWQQARVSQITEVRSFEGHTGPVNRVVFSRDGMLALSGSGYEGGDLTARLWEVATGREVHLLNADGRQILAVCFSPDGLRAAGSGVGGVVYVWDVTSGDEITSFPANTEVVEDVSFSPDGRHLLCVAHKRTPQRDIPDLGAAQLWDMQTQTLVWQIESEGWLVTGEFLTDERILIAGWGTGGAVHVLDRETGEELQRWQNDDGEPYRVQELAISRDGRFVATASELGYVCLWDVESGGTAVRIKRNTGFLKSVSFSPDGRRLLIGGQDGRIQLLDVSTLRTIATTNHPSGRVWSLAYAPDGRHALSAGGLAGEALPAFSLRLWRLPESAPPQAEERPSDMELGAFVVLDDAGVERRFDSLAAAVEASGPGDTIEVRGNGPFLTEPIVLRHALVLRAGEGFQPVIKRSRGLLRQDPALITIHAPLVVEALTFEHDLADIKNPKFLDSYDVDRLRVANCRFVMTSQEGYAIAGEARDVEVRNCEFVMPDGYSVAFTCRSDGRWVIDNCVLVGTIGFFHPVASTFRTGSPDPQRPAAIHLKRNTVVARSGLHAARFDRSSVPEDETAGAPIRIRASSNVFDTWSSVFLSSFRITDRQTGVGLPPPDAASLPARLIDWDGARNVYPARGSLILIQCYNRLESSEKSHAIELAEWNSFWDSSDGGSLQGEVRFAGEYRDGEFVAESEPDYQSLTAADFRLHADSAGYRGDPQGKDLGADVGFVGPGEADERWKKTKEYAEWLDDTAQLMASAVERDPGNEGVDNESAKVRP